jgi:hypothetical protein
MFINRLLGIASLSVFFCAAQSNAPTHSIFNQNDVSWAKGPRSLPPGAEIAVLEGDPAKEGQFTMRLRDYRMATRYRRIGIPRLSM